VIVSGGYMSNKCVVFEQSQRHSAKYLKKEVKKMEEEKIITKRKKFRPLGDNPKKMMITIPRVVFEQLKNIAIAEQTDLQTQIRFAIKFYIIKMKGGETEEVKKV
jgi:hypothetical protein